MLCNYTIIGYDSIYLFITSFFIPVVIPQDINNLPAYNKIQGNFLSVMMLSGMFPMAFIYVLYCAFDFDQNVKDNSGWLSIASMGVLIAVILAIVNRGILNMTYRLKTIE